MLQKKCRFNSFIVIIIQYLFVSEYVSLGTSINYKDKNVST
jgi:hypothetical protein